MLKVFAVLVALPIKLLEVVGMILDFLAYILKRMGKVLDSTNNSDYDPDQVEFIRTGIFLILLVVVIILLAVKKLRISDK